MAALDSDLAFEDILQRTSEFAQVSRSDIEDRPRAGDQGARLRIVFWAVAAGLVLAAAVTLVTGYSALVSDTPQIWIHRLMAFVIVQSLLIAAIALKISPRLENQALPQRVAVSAPSANASGTPAASQTMPLTKVEPNLPKVAQATASKAGAGGTLAGRPYLLHLDGTIEIETLVGRRRFVSIEAAQEFVGR